MPLVAEQQREPLYSAEEMRAAEAAYSGPTLELMERAGARVAEELLRAYPGAQRIAVWCGTGANGGDGLVAATELTRAGKECAVRLLGSEDRFTGDSAVVLARAKEAGVPFVDETGPADVAVVALFGTGFAGFVAGLEYAAGVEAEVVGKPSLAYFEAALAELGAEPGEAVMVGDDIDADIGGGQAAGLRTVLVRTGKFREETLAAADAKPDVVLDSIADVPAFLRENA